MGQEDTLEKEMATHSSTLAWKIPWTEKPGRLQSMGSQKSWTRLSNFTFFLSSVVIILAPQEHNLHPTLKAPEFSVEGARAEIL